MPAELGRDDAFVIGSVLLSFVAEPLPWFDIGLSGTDVPGTA